MNGHKIPVISRSKPQRGTKDIQGSHPDIMRLVWNKYVGEANFVDGRHKRINVSNVEDLALHWLARNMSGHQMPGPNQKVLLDRMGQRLKRDIEDYMADVQEYGA